MNNRFSAGSLQKLMTCHSDLQALFTEVSKHINITIVCGYRSPEAQDELYEKGYSKLEPGRSKHNLQPSLAIDVAPYPIDWQDTRRFYFLAGIVKACAAQLGLKVRGGYDWDRDNDFNDQTFNDLGHFELI